MSAGTSFVTGTGMGLLAGLTTCAALHTGLLAGLTSRPGARPAPLVARFLAGKLVAHTVLGALLGGLGAAVQPGPSIRAALLVVSGVVLAYFAFRLVSPRHSPRHDCQPPSRFGRPQRSEDRPNRPSGVWGSSPRWAGFGNPLVIGVATVFVPCGITVSAELLAVASGSAVAGATVMAGFVLGTAPLTGVLGVGAGLLRGLPSRLLGVALLAVAGWTVLGGVRLGGWLPAGEAATPPIDARFVATDASGVQTVTVHALDRGYRPALLSARAGVPTVLVLSTRGTTGCTRAFTLPRRGVSVLLAETGETRIDLGVPSPGRLPFVCAAGHYPGSITFR